MEQIQTQQPFAAPLPHELVYSANAMPIIEKIETEVPNNGFERLVDHFGENPEMPIKSSELIGALGNVAIKTEIPVNTFRENWRAGGKNVLERLGTLMSRGIYRATTPRFVREAKPFNRNLPYGGDTANFGHWFSKNMKKVVSSDVRSYRLNTSLPTHEATRNSARSEVKRLESVLASYPSNEPLESFVNKERYKTTKKALRAERKIAKIRDKYLV